MRTFFKISALFIIATTWVACEGDYRQKARGGFGEAVVIMDSTQFKNETANAIRGTYGKSINTILSSEPLFDLRFRDFKNNDELEQLKRFKNIIIAAPISDSSNVAKWVRSLLSDKVENQVRNGESFAFPLQNKWYKDQWTMILTSPTDTALARQIQNSEKILTDNLFKKEFQRWNEEIYGQGEQVELADSIWTNHGWKVRIQHDWLKNIDTTYTQNGEENHFLTMRRVLPENNRWFWAWWKDDVKDISYLDNNWINTKRDSLMKKWIRGSRDSSYVTTEYQLPVETEVFEMNADLTHETLGWWRMTNDAMGGPFVNFTIYDDEADRLYMVEFGQFAPKFDKRRFVRQFRTMLRTFSSDSTWQAPENPPVEEN